MAGVGIIFPRLELYKLSSWQQKGNPPVGCELNKLSQACSAASSEVNVKLRRLVYENTCRESKDLEKACGNEQALDYI